ncbi:MAG: DNA polymerase III subunit beta [Elusimicrobia bacterium]|nr:DNA polymerase III subunit beta [Elusimicrobiota bacterium]
MKVKIDKKDLINRLQIVQNTISRRSSLPILSNYLLETELKAKKLWITSTDLEMSVRSSLNAVIEEEGSITLPAKKLGEILHELPMNGSQIDVVFELKENNRVQVLGSHSRFQIAGIPRDDYPALPDFDEKKAVAFPPKILMDMIKKTVFAASTDETRYVLNGVLFILAKGKINLVATDGRRLAAAGAEGLPAGVEFKAIVPAKALSEVGRIIAHLQEELPPDEKVFVEISENKAGFKFGETTLFSRLIDGNFPGWEQVIPRRSSIVARINREAFAAVTKRASLCITDRVGTCRYRFTKAACQVTSKTLGHYEFEEDIPVLSFQGEEGFEISFNPHHVIDFLKSVDGDVFEVSMTTAVNPALFSTPEAPGYTYVVMPTRVQN